MTATVSGVVGEELNDADGVGYLDVRAVLKKAEDELCTLKHQRTVLTSRIGTVRQTITALLRFLGGTSSADQLARRRTRNHRRTPGITDTCRKVLIAATCPLTAEAVRDIIQETTPTILAHHKHPLASVSTVLGRLAEYREARTSISDGGQRVWESSIENELAQRFSPEKPLRNAI